MSYIGSVVTGDTGINAERVPASYIPLNYNISGNTIKDHLEGLDNLISKSSSFTGNKEKFILDGTDISNGYIDLSKEAINETITFFVSGSTIFGETDMYSVDYTGGVSGFTRITFESSLLSILQTGDTIYTEYLYRNGLNFQASPHADTHIKDGGDQINGNQLFLDYSPSNYTQTGDTLGEHIEKIDEQLLKRQEEVSQIITITGTTHTLLENEAGGYLRCTNSSPVVINVPTGLTIVKTVTTVRQASLGTVTISGGTFNGNTQTAGQNTQLQFVCVDNDIYDIIN